MENHQPLFGETWLWQHHSVGMLYSAATAGKPGKSCECKIIMKNHSFSSGTNKPNTARATRTLCA